MVLSLPVLTTGPIHSAAMVTDSASLESEVGSAVVTDSASLMSEVGSAVVTDSASLMSEVD